MSATELLLIDLSSIAHAIFHVSGNEPDPSFIANQIVVKVRQLASAHPHAAVCLDSGRSFRHDLAPDYKANRDTGNRAVITHQIEAACDVLRADGFPVWAAKGYEADDVIATAVREALAMDPSVTVLIASADKDLCQLVSDRVRIKSTHPQSSGDVRGPTEVLEKFKVRPDQMLDYLCLVGDSSDNVKGAWKVGPKIAADLLGTHGSIEAIYAAIDQGVVPGISPALRTNLQEFRERWPLVRQLIALKADAPIAIAEIGVERTVKAMVEDGELPEGVTPERGQCAEYFADAERVSRELTPEQPADALSADAAKIAERIKNGPTAEENDRLRNAPIVPMPRQELVHVAPRDYSQELEPRNPEEAVRVAGHLFKSRLLGAYGAWEGVFLVIMAGRALGMSVTTALDNFHIIEGKPRLSAGGISGRVLASNKARYFRCSERTATSATFVTKRGDDPEMSLTYTMAEARTAYGFDVPMTEKERADLERKWQRSGWGKNSADMLVARASSKLARLVYPDVVSGLYAPEEMD